MVRQRLTVGVGAVALTVAMFALNFYRMPVVALSPGPVEDVLGRVRVEGGAKVYDSSGKLYLTSVGLDDNTTCSCGPARSCSPPTRPPRRSTSRAPPT